MLINLRNAMMAGKRLPYDAELEYLESNGNQFVDTTYVPAHNDVLKIRYRAAYVRPAGIISSRYGAWDANPNYWIYVKFAGLSDIQLWSFSPRQTIIAERGWYDTDVDMEICLPLGYVKSTRDGSSITTNITVGTSHADQPPLILFADSKSRIYSFRVERDGITVVDLIPVRRGTVGYLYDRVSRKLFGNAGTGDFVLGPDVVPVEYLRGDGSSAIETDIQWQLKAAYTEVDFRMPDTRDSVSKRLLGSSASSFNYIVSRRGTRADYFGFNGATEPLLELVSGTQYKGAAWYENDLYNFSLNGSVATYSTTVHGTAGSFCVFDVTRSSYEDTCFKGDISAVRIYANKAKVQLLNNLQAVRVGAGSTWEGAMMDVLTRRIYRNAGTGAFTYGNDLRYPIPSE